MKKITPILLAVFFSAVLVYAQDFDYDDNEQDGKPDEEQNYIFTFSGEVKTGYYAEHERIGDLEPRNYNTMGNTDGDSGFGDSRMRLNVHAGYKNIGLHVRFQVESGAGGAFSPAFNYAYAYANMFKDQFSVSAGILGNSPWGSGGPNIRQELETRETVRYNPNNGDITTQTSGLIGIRFEYKPNFYPEKYGRLNIGFVLNQPDGSAARSSSDQLFTELLGETVIGISYTHEYFAASFAYRFDSGMDLFGSETNEGGRLTYRLEERAIGKLVDGMQLSLNGYYFGIGMEQFPMDVGGGNMIGMGGGEYFVNWLYWLWDHRVFTAKCDVGFTINKDRYNRSLTPWLRQEYKILEVMPAFYYKFLNDLLRFGVGLGFGMEFGSGKTYENSSYQYIYVEPQIRLNLSNNSYIALLYNFTHKYAHPDINVITTGQTKTIESGDMSNRHWINLRVVFSF